MNTDQFYWYTELLFGDLLAFFKDQGEYGFNNKTDRTINRIGYSTNISPEIIEQAKEKSIDLIVTHHDAWDFVFGMKDECIRKLKQYEIGHFYIHLPLDYVEFGTCNSLFHEIGVNKIIQQSKHVNGDSVIGVGLLPESISFNQLVDRMSTVLSEDVKAWNFGTKSINRIGILTGAGNGTNHIRDALQLNCDVYITGEKTLYTIQYAKYVGMNLIVGSHTFTEIFGIKSYANKLKERFPQLEIEYLVEEHFE